MAGSRRNGVVEAADGTPISFHSHGDSGGPVLLLTNGIGTTENFWRFLIEELDPDFTIVHWDYRGHGSSPVAVSGDYSLQTQADDLARVTRQVMEKNGRPPIHVAFSMGVAVLLEMYRAHPELVRAMALIAGAPDAPGTGTLLFRVPGSLATARALAAAATPLVPVVAPLLRAFLRTGFPYAVGRLTGVLQGDSSKEDIRLFLHGVAKMNPTAYWMTLRGLLEARGSDVLPSVKVPVLIVAAAKDVLMPLKQVENMRRGLPHSSFVLVDEAGHAGLVEKGQEIARAVRGLVTKL